MKRQYLLLLKYFIFNFMYEPHIVNDVSTETCCPSVFSGSESLSTKRTVASLCPSLLGSESRPCDVVCGTFHSVSVYVYVDI